MTALYPKTIILKGDGIRKEAKCTGAVTPGMLVEKLSTGNIRPHALAAGNAQRAFAIEDDLQGKTIADVYATTTLVQYEVLPPGAEVLAILNDGENVAIGDPLESAGNGKLRKHVPDIDINSSSASSTVYTAPIVAWAMEAKDMSDSSAADPDPKFAVELN